MRKIKQIYEELDVYYNYRLLNYIFVSLVPSYILIFLFIVGKILNFTLDAGLEIEFLFIPLIAYTLLSLRSFYSTWSKEVTPLFKKVRHQIDVKEKWDVLLNQFNRRE